MNTNQSATMYESVPVVSELNKVQGFDPLKFLRRTTKGEKVLDLKYKKLWFRLKYPNGRIKLSSLKITDQLAMHSRDPASLPKERRKPLRAVCISSRRSTLPSTRHCRTQVLAYSFLLPLLQRTQRKRPKPSKSSRQ